MINYRFKLLAKLYIYLERIKNINVGIVIWKLTSSVVPIFSVFVGEFPFLFADLTSKIIGYSRINKYNKLNYNVVPI